jgi:hypothetical protein
MTMKELYSRMRKPVIFTEQQPFFKIFQPKAEAAAWLARLIITTAIKLRTAHG